jgi:hypothetical protein
MESDIAYPPKGKIECPNCNGHGSSLSEEGQRCTRCQGTGLLKAPRRISELTPEEIESIIEEYDAGMRRYTELDAERMREVAENADGEVLCEVIDTAVRMGYAVHETTFDYDDVELLRAAVKAYQLRLRTALADADSADVAGRIPPDHES